MILIKNVADDPKKNDSYKYDKINELRYLLKYGKGIKYILCKLFIKFLGIKTCAKIIASIKK